MLQLGLLLLCCWGISQTSAQSTSSNAPDCELTNGTACIYSLGQCQADTDCPSVLGPYLPSLGFTSTAIPSDSIYACVGDKCDFATPSTVCASGSGLPTCNSLPGFAPVPAPADGNQTGTGSAPSATVTSSDCYLTNQAGTECAYEFGACQTQDDCQSVIASYLSTFGVANSQIPSNATFGCLSSGKCDIFFPTDGCLASITLPMCNSGSAPGPGPEGAAASAGTGPAAPSPPPVVFSPICSTTILGSGRGCCIEFGGSCRTFKDCSYSIVTYFQTATPPLTTDPSDSLPACYGGQCFYASDATACGMLGSALPTCTDGDTCVRSAANLTSVSPPPAVNVHLLPSPPSSTPAPSGSASAAPPTPSPVPAPSGAARLKAGLTRGTFFVVLSVLAASSQMVLC